MAVDIKSAFQELASDERLIQSTGEIIKNKVFYENLEDFFTIIPGIKGGQQVAAMKGIEYITKKDDGCGGAFLSPDFPAISQKWEPQLAKVGLKYCYTDLMNWFTQWGLKNGYAIKDLSEIEFILFIEEFVSDAIKADMQRLVLLGNADIATDNVLQSAPMAEHYDVVKKGLVETLKYFKTIGALSENFVDLTQNTAMDPFDFSNDYAVKLYRQLTRELDFDEGQILSSARLHDNYEDFFENLGQIESQAGRIQNGQGRLSRSGVPIIPTKGYDRWRKRDFVAAYTPHFALHTAKSNLLVGVDDERSIEDITFEYVGGSDENFYIKANYMIDFKIPDPYSLKAAI